VSTESQDHDAQGDRDKVLGHRGRGRAHRIRGVSADLFEANKQPPIRDENQDLEPLTGGLKSRGFSATGEAGDRYNPLLKKNLRVGQAFFLEVNGTPSQDVGIRDTHRLPPKDEAPFVIYGFRAGF